MKPKEKNKILIEVILFSVAVVLVTLAVGRLPIFKVVERVTIDLRFRMRRSSTVDPRLSLILVDPATMDKYGYPVPRRYYAIIANTLCENDATAVVIDRTFEARDTADRVGSAMLNRVLGQHDNIVVAWQSPLQNTVYSANSSVVPRRFAMPHKIDESVITPYDTSLHREDASLPYYEALQSLKWLGSVMAKPAEESVDRIEKVPLVVKHGEYIYPAISLITVCIALKVELADVIIERKKISIPTQDGVIAIPIDEKGQIWVNYLDDRSVFLRNTDSLSTVYESITLSPGYSAIPLEHFKDGIVLIGNSDTTMGTDMYTTPFGSRIPGVAIHAMVIDSILNRHFIGAMAWHYNLIILVVSIFCILYTQKLFSPRVGLICLVVLLICIWIFAIAFFQGKGILLNISQPTFGMIFAFASISFYNYVTELRRVRHIRQIFGKHVSEEVVDQLVLETDGQIPMAEREVSALFADISGHSNWANHLAPSEFAKELNECLEAMAQAAFENGGTINLFLGDGVLVIYNAPVEQSDHALRAIKTGIAIQKHISKLNEKRVMQNKQKIGVRVGINTGSAMAGTIGSKDRFEYTVIGDTVNMAKRTESECEPGKVAITDDVVRRVGELVQVESIGLRSVKGREAGLMLYHVINIQES